MKRLVEQKHEYGCAVSCLALIMGITYDDALKYFNSPAKIIDEGFLLDEVCLALQRAGFTPFWAKFSQAKHFPDIETPNTIVFIERSEQYPAGHYIVRNQDSWHNSWCNFPEFPIRAKNQSFLPGAIEYVIFTGTK